MRRGAIVSSFVWALSVGGLIAILNGDRRAVSLRIWLAAFAIWFALATAQRLFAEVPLTRARLQPLVAWRRARSSAYDSRLREIRTLENLVLRARENERVYTTQLQPRLLALADHYLPMSHGIDRQREPERAAELFGELNRLLDGRSASPSPTMAEIDALLDVLTPTEHRVPADRR